MAKDERLTTQTTKDTSLKILRKKITDKVSQGKPGLPGHKLFKPENSHLPNGNYQATCRQQDTNTYRLQATDAYEHEASDT